MVKYIFCSFLIHTDHTISKFFENAQISPIYPFPIASSFNVFLPQSVSNCFGLESRYLKTFYWQYGFGFSQKNFWVALGHQEKLYIVGG